MQLKTLFKRFVLDENDEVEGVMVSENYIYPNPKTGEIRRLRAKRPLFWQPGFCPGYHVQDHSEPESHCRHREHQSTRATAESLIEAIRIGATPIQLSLIQLGPWASRDEEGFGVGSMFSMLAGFPYGILVDRSSGRRFVNELSDRKLLVDAMLNSGREAVAIVDSKGVQHASTLEKCLKRGVVKQYESIDELANDNRIPLEALKNTILSYNASVEKGVDDEFGKPITDDLSPIQFPPYFSIRLISKVHHCMGA